VQGGTAVSDVIVPSASTVNDTHHHTASVTELDNEEDEDVACDPAQVIL